MKTLTTKNAVKCSLNQKTRQIRFTQQFFKTITEGNATLGSAPNFVILNKRMVEKLVNEGWSIVDTKSTNNITKQSTPIEVVDLTGNPETEEAIRRNYIKRNPVSFVKNAKEFSQQNMKSALEVFGATIFKKQEPIHMNSAFEKFHRSEIGRERKAQQMQMMEVSQ